MKDQEAYWQCVWRYWEERMSDPLENFRMEAAVVAEVVLGNPETTSEEVDGEK